MHTFYNANTQMGEYGLANWIMIVFNNDVAPQTKPADFQVRQGPGSPNAGNLVTIEEVLVRRNLVFLRATTPLTLVPRLEVIAGSTIKDVYGQSFVATQTDVFGISVSDPATGQFGVAPSGSAARIVAGGFGPGERVSITAIDGGSQQSVGQLTATENGTISGFFAMPFPVGGPYSLTATGTFSPQQTATFDVIAQ